MNQSFYEEVKSHFNEPVLVGFTLQRCVGYAEDEDDCYMIVSGHTGLSYVPMSGGYVYLACLRDQGVTIPVNPTFKGEIWTDFTRLDSLLTLNGVPKFKNFILEVEG